MTIGTKIGAVFVLALFGMLAIGVSSYVSTQRLLENEQWVTHTYLVLEKLDHVLAILQDAETGQRGYIITDRQQYLEPFDRAQGQIKTDLDEVRKLTSDNPAQQKNLDGVESLSQEKLQELRETIELENSHHHDQAVEIIKTDRGKKSMDALRAAIGDMESMENRLLGERDAKARQAASRTMWTLGIWMPLSLLVLAVTAVVTVRRMRFVAPEAAPAPVRAAWKAITLRYGLAVAAVAVGVAVRWWMESLVGSLPLFVTFSPAVLLVAVIAGGGPGILTSLLCALAADYWFVEPRGSLHIMSANDLVALGIFLATGIVLSIVAERLRRTRWTEAFAAAKEQEAVVLAKQNDELRRQSEELTEQSEEISQQNEELRAQSEEIQALNSELVRREGLLERLLESARQTASERAVMDGLCAMAKDILGQPAVSAVAVYEKQDGQFHIQAQAGLSVTECEWPQTGNSFCGFVLQKGRTAGLNDVSVRPDLAVLSVDGQEPFRAVLATPLLVDGMPVGVVSAYARQPLDWTDEQFRLVEWLSGQCGRILGMLRMQDGLRRQAALIDLSPDGIVVRKLDGTITFWSHGAQKLYGWSQEEAIGRKTHELFQTGFPQSLEEIVAQLQRDGRWAGELTHRTKDGREISVQSWWSAQRDENGQITELLESNVDITERKAAEEALKMSVEELGQSNRDLEQFAYVASHDLQEPLRMVSSFVGLLRGRYGASVDGKGREYMQYAIEGAQRMQSLVIDLLNYSRAGRTMQLAPVDTQKAFDAAMANLKPAVTESGAVVTVEKLPMALGDHSQLIQLFQNLIANAIKFRGSEPPKIRCGACVDSGYWTFYVRDNGIGIKPEHFDRIFLIFQRLHTRQHYPGTGVGLAVCKRIIERHGGRIWIESELGKGATFYFTLQHAEDGNGSTRAQTDSARRG